VIRAQLAAILRLEWKRTLFRRRALGVWALASLPPLLTISHSLVEISRGGTGHSLPNDTAGFAVIFQLFYLRLAIFFGCVGIFSNLFRGEVLARTLHYYLLAPVRREVLLAGKYLAGLASAALLFGAGVALTFCGLYLHFGPGFSEFLWRAGGAGQLFQYVAVAMLASAGYGAVFVLVGLMFRNPMLPAAAIMIWEAVNTFLPAALQKCSIIFYLKSLSPVQVPAGGPLALIAVVADPVPAWMAVPGLLGVSLLLLAWAAAKARSFEIRYSE
jgi:ABC-type transport system involved in multi-copper enzyme maturation permease subunit